MTGGVGGIAQVIFLLVLCNAAWHSFPPISYANFGHSQQVDRLIVFLQHSPIGSGAPPSLRNLASGMATSFSQVAQVGLLLFCFCCTALVYIFTDPVFIFKIYFLGALLPESSIVATSTGRHLQNWALLHHG